MPRGFTNQLERRILDHLHGGPNLTRPGTVYVGLSTTAIAEDGSGITEPADGYARVPVDNTNGDWLPASTDANISSKVNAEPIAFPTASGNWGTVTHFFISDDLTSVLEANTWSFGPLTVSKSINDGDTASFAAGDLEIRLRPTTP
jgi:hypothetical protein